MRTRALWLAATAFACLATARADDPPGGKDKADDPNSAAAMLQRLLGDRPDFARAANEEEAIGAFLEKSVRLADEITGLADATPAQKGSARQRKLFLLHAGAFDLKKAEFRKQYDAFAAAAEKDDPASELSGFVKGLAVIRKGGEEGPVGAEVLAFAKEFPKHPFVGELAMLAAQRTTDGDPEAAKKLVRELLAVVPASGPAGRQLAGLLKSMVVRGDMTV